MHSLLSFRNFWPGFDPNDNFFTSLLREFSEHEWQVVPDGYDVDVSISSVFTFRNDWDRLGSLLRSRIRRQELRYIERSRYGIPAAAAYARRNVWFTGENMRPPTKGWDLTLSFDSDPRGGKNLYLPLWVLYWPEEATQTGIPIRSSKALQEFRYHLLAESDIRRSGFCIAFFGNPEPMRENYLHALNTLDRVDAYGRLVGEWVDDKRQTSLGYRFALCPENDLFPGYVTEKPLEAWLNGNIPIWWGIDIEGYLNPDALINAAGLTTEELVSRVATISKSAHLIGRYQAEPILRRDFDLTPIVSAFDKLV